MKLVLILVYLSIRYLSNTSSTLRQPSVLLPYVINTSSWVDVRKSNTNIRSPRANDNQPPEKTYISVREKCLMPVRACV